MLSSDVIHGMSAGQPSQPHFLRRCCSFMNGYAASTPTISLMSVTRFSVAWSFPSACAWDLSSSSSRRRPPWSEIPSKRSPLKPTRMPCLSRAIGGADACSMEMARGESEAAGLVMKVGSGSNEVRGSHVNSSVAVEPSASAGVAKPYACSTIVVCTRETAGVRIGHWPTQCPSLPHAKHGAGWGQSAARCPGFLQLPQRTSVQSLAQCPFRPQREQVSQGRAVHRRGGASSDGRASDRRGASLPSPAESERCRVGRSVAWRFGGDGDGDGDGESCEYGLHCP